MTFFVIPGLTRNPENSLFSMDSRGNDNEAKSLILQKSKIEYKRLITMQILLGKLINFRLTPSKTILVFNHLD
jgi:hypothetical protein